MANERLALLTVGLAVLALALPRWSSAEPNNPHTDWFQKAGWGVFVHYLAGLQNGRDSLHSFGKQTEWDDAVREFDTERFAQTMADVGAPYVIFTILQVSRFMIAPNATFDRISGYQPGEACARRDLIEDLYQSLHQRGIPLLLYYTGDGPRADERAGPAFGCSVPVTDDFVQKWADVAREYGERYKDKVVGYWVDGSYPFIGYDDKKLAVFAAGLKAGNPNRIIAFNRGVDPLVMSYTPHEDFTCGEQNSFFDMPSQRFLDGEQWHILSFLGPSWAQPGTKYTKRELAEYVYDVNQRGGVVSIDVMLYRDGSLDRSQVEMLKAVRDFKRELGGRPIPAVPPGNLAYRKQARLLSLDGSHPLLVNGGVCFPRLGVDGHMETAALAGGEWPWTYEVDLVDTVALKRLKITFGSGFATEFEFRVSVDGQNWQTVARRENHDGSPIDATFAPVQARFVRACAIKPDGPDQPGRQMMVAELEAYQ